MTDWAGNWRRDGLVIVTSPETTCFIILPGDDRPATEHCPCCCRLLVSEDAARRVADAVYPLKQRSHP